MSSRGAGSSRRQRNQKVWLLPPFTYDYKSEKYSSPKDYYAGIRAEWAFRVTEQEGLFNDLRNFGAPHGYMVHGREWESQRWFGKRHFLMPKYYPVQGGSCMEPSDNQTGYGLAHARLLKWPALFIERVQMERLCRENRLKVPKARSVEIQKEDPDNVDRLYERLQRALEVAFVFVNYSAVVFASHPSSLLVELHKATSGAIGALVSTTILYPLDTCKTKYQAEIRAHNQQKYRNTSDVFWEAISNHQVLSLYQGLGTKNLQSVIFSFVYFYGYSFFKKLYLKRSGSKSIETKANLVLAAAAGACTVVVTQPLDTASSRMQTSEFGKSKGLWKTLSENTWSEAFDGLGISLLLTANPSIQYTAFDQLKRRLLKRQLSKKRGTEPSSEALSAFSAFALGAVSKCIATCLTYPAIRCKVMIQAESDEDETKEDQPKAQKTVSGAIHTIWKREGLLGFFKGLQAQILKTVLSSALLMMVKEKITKTTWVLMLALQRYLSITKTRLKNA
ncbi:hypothetical protein HYC85_019386 [Camellia sinensis]|uniref:Peroxisomal adenine nucleotide carrier 1 n=1 Tax=Camellia sinensis TaxID=4442 RepID=A0A7J7GQN8_CAMSI|nr:hypothetical protein HYC85_019386 [Camellia sinensis]